MTTEHPLQSSPGSIGIEISTSTEQWMATLAHELRDPLSAVIMSLEELQEVCESDASAQMTRDLACKRAWHMARVIEDVLDLSRRRPEKAQMSRENVDLAQVVAAVVRDVRPFIAERNHELTLSMPPGSVTFSANPTHLQQILVNLLTNAAKYTPQGGQIFLSAETSANNVVLRVRDNGNGVSSEQLSLLFKPFWQAVESTSGTVGGIGIGLSLVKTLVDLHGGTIAVHSDGPGAGSEFIVRLPANGAFAQNPEQETGTDVFAR